MPTCSSNTLTIVDSAADAPQAVALMAQLSARLADITGDDGRRHFSIEPAAPGTAFVLALDGGVAVGCGALRPLAAGGPGVAEIKRMYASRPGQGIGTALLAALEQRARALGYTAVWLETRAVNQRAVGFYLRHGYRVREAYGPYVGRPEAVCFEKALIV